MPFARLLDRSLLLVRGETAIAFLQNLVTSDVEAVGEHEVRPSALLTPQGKILFDFLLGRIDGGIRIDVATIARADLLKRLTLYRLRALIAFETPDVPVFATWDEAVGMTDRRFDGALACLVDLADPPAEAPDTYGQWKGGWVDFAGTGVDIGSSHGDPGRFGSGVGAELPAGRSLAFGDYRCRVDRSDVYCVDYAHQTGVTFAATGIEGFGCLRRTAPPAGIGDHLSC